MKDERTHIAVVKFKSNPNIGMYNLKIQDDGTINYWSEVENQWSKFPYFKKETSEACGVIQFMNIIEVE